MQVCNRQFAGVLKLVVAQFQEAVVLYATCFSDSVFQTSTVND